MKNTIKITVILFFLSITSIHSQDANQFFTKANTFFNTYVANGKVDYKDIKASPALLNELVTEIASIQVTKSKSQNTRPFGLMLTIYR